MAPNRGVLIVLPERVHLMDVVGPAQVFTSAAEAGAGYALSYVAERSGTETHQGLGLTAPTSWPALGEGDLVIVPGWRAQAGGRFSTSCRPVCSTGFVGIGNAAVISPPCAPSLRARRGRPPGGAHGHYPSRPDRGVGAGCRGIRVPGDVLFTCEERGHTSAGIASGTDLALHIVISSLMTMGRHWQPEWPAASSCPSQGPGRPRSHMDELVHCAQDILDDPDRLPWTLDALARDLGASRRTLPRRFAAATGLSPQAYARAVRRERAERLHSQEASWEEAARAVGYADARSPRARRVPSASSV